MEFGFISQNEMFLRETVQCCFTLNSTYAVGLLSLSFPIQIAYSLSLSFTETVVGRVIEDLTPQNNKHQHYIYFYVRRNIVFVLLQ